MRTMLSQWQQKISDGVDRLTLAVSPRRAYLRRAYRFAYDALDNSRTRKPRGNLSGSGDAHLTESALSRLREICRDMGRNNPIVKGLLATETKGVVGSETKVEARTKDERWNERAERLWRAEMVDQPCDVTGRFNFHMLLKLAYQSYRRDGDDFIVFGPDMLWLVEGQQCGTPHGLPAAQHYEVVNGVATAKSDGHVVGYYIGKADRWGFIQGDAYGWLTPDRVHHVFNPDRVSYTRGEPILTSAIDWIDKLYGYANAALVAAKVNALFVMALTKRFPEGTLPSIRQTANPPSFSEEGFKQEKLGAGLIYECAPGEDAKAIAAQHPSAEFESFFLRCLMVVARPLCLPLMLATLDYSGATFMNARIAYQEAWDQWKDEQNLVVKPLVSRIWRWKVQQWLARGELAPREDAFEHEVVCKRWPYVDPYKEAMADKVDLENGTNTRTAIVARTGRDYRDVVREQVRERKTEQQEGLLLPGEGEEPEDGKEAGDAPESQ